MCLNPLLIKNVNYGNTSKLNFLVDATSQYMPVPCGRCSVCLSLKQQYIIQRVQMESLSHDLYYGTLTYNNESLPRLESGEFKLAHVDIADWQKMIKMIRKHENLPDFKYLLVTEYGGRKHRPHIHFLLSFLRDDSQTLADRRSFEIRLFKIFLNYWRRNYGSTRVPEWRPLCTYRRTFQGYNYDLHYLDPRSSTDGADDVAFYVTKYVLKFDKWLDKLKSKLFFTLPEDEFSRVWGLMRPRLLISKGFGSTYDPKVYKHLCKGIDLALKDGSALYPYFISPVNGSTFPLSPYYSMKLLTIQDQVVFNSRKPTLTDNDMMLDSSSELSLEEIFRKQLKFDNVCEFLQHRNLSIDEDFDDFSNLKSNTHGNFTEIPLMAEVFADSWQDFESDRHSPDDDCHDLL